ncbi:MAG: hypothetical protein ACOC4G_12975 [Bacillota bacterium]
MSGEVTKITVRWWDGYKEDFEAVRHRVGSDFLWMKLKNGDIRWIPLRHVRWFNGAE